MQPIHTLIIPTLACALAAPVHAAGGSSNDPADTTHSSQGYKYDRSMNAGGRAGGSTVPRGAEPAAPDKTSKDSSGYHYDKSMNAGGYAGGSTVPREPKPKERGVN